MTKDEMRALREGDIVRGKSSGMAFIITGNYGERLTAVRSVDITNPDEWEKVEVEYTEIKCGCNCKCKSKVN